jgi:chromosome segregation ATPase
MDSNSLSDESGNSDDLISGDSMRGNHVQFNPKCGIPIASRHRPSEQLLTAVKEKTALSNRLESEMAARRTALSDLALAETREKNHQCKYNDLSDKYKECQTAYQRLKEEFDRIAADKKSIERKHLSEVESLKAELQRKEQQSESQIDSILREKRRLESEVKRLTEDAARSRIQHGKAISVLDQKLAESSDQIQNLKGERDEIARKLQELNQTAASELNAVKRDVKQLEKTAQENERLRQELSESAYEKQELKSQTTSLSAKLESVQRRLLAVQQNSQGKLEAARNEIDELQRKNFDLRESKSKQNREFERTKQLIEEIKRHILSSDSDDHDDSIPEQIGNLITRLGTMSRAEEKSRSRAEKLQKENETLSAENGQLQTKIQRVSVANNNQMRDMDNAEAAITSLRNQIGELKNNLAITSDELKKSAQALESARTKTAALSQTLDDKTRELKAQLKAKEDIESQKERLENKLNQVSRNHEIGRASCRERVFLSV